MEYNRVLVEYNRVLVEYYRILVECYRIISSITSCVTPAGTSNELDVQNEWEETENTLTRTFLEFERGERTSLPYFDKIIM